MSSAAFCHYLHISFLVLYISEKVPVGIPFCIQKWHHRSCPFSFLILLCRTKTHLILNITHRTLPSALYAFPQPARPFLTGLNLSFTLHRISPLLERLAALSSIPLSPTSHCSVLRFAHCSVLRFVRRCRLRLECISLSGAKIMQGTKIRRKRKPLAPYLILFHPWLHRWCAVGVTALRSISPG